MTSTAIHETDHPLVTFALLAYNQQAYIKQAVEAALAQTYSPLEIILSDDASDDGTATIIRDLAAAYHGPHNVVVNINAKNLGIGAHVNRMFESAHGKLLILAAGDDISRPLRTTRTVTRWIASQCTMDAIYCGADTINADGEPASQLSIAIDRIGGAAESLISFPYPNRLLVLGACFAYTKRIYENFGPLRNDLPIEDIPLAIRASLLGGIAKLDERLVLYRRNTSSWLPRKEPGEALGHHLSRIVRRARAQHALSLQLLDDTNHIRDITLKSLVAKRLKATKVTIDAVNGSKHNICYVLKCAFGNIYWRYTLPTFILNHKLLYSVAISLRRIALPHTR